MTPEQYQRINALADAALDLQAAARPAFLAKACEGDDELRDRVQGLVTEQESGEGFLEEPAIETLAREMARGLPRESLAGREIDRYQILSLLGAGGIGEVWLARDHQLSREVAVKLLSAAFAGDPEHVLAFQQEARAASQLNHPNIVTIYQIGEAGGRHFIAQEFVPGQTLRQKLAEGPLDPAAVLEIAAQIAGAIEAAHTAQIVHRDIKPENVMVRPDGLVKVLDFGLARFIQFEPPGPSASRPGQVLGTVRYMSPEQARGLEVDARSDIFSFGVMLYEMLAGSAPFAGSTPAETLAAVVLRQPAPLPRSLPDAAEMERIVRRCLEKDRKRRYQSAAELRFDLLRLSRRLESAAPRARGRLVLAAAGAIVLAGLVFALLTATNGDRTAAPLNPVTLTRLTTRGKVAETALSPDGGSVAYALDEGDRQSLWLKRIASNQDVEIAAPETSKHLGLTFSPDGRFLYYVRREQDGVETLYKLATSGGGRSAILTGVGSPIAFSPNGKQFAFIRLDPFRSDTALMVANADGSGERAIEVRRRPRYFSRSAIAWSPDGRAIICLGGDASFYTQEAFHPVEVRVADGSERAIGAASWAIVGSLVWSGRNLILAAGNHSDALLQIWQISYPEGVARRLTNDLMNYPRLSFGAGTLAAVQSETLADLWVAPGTDVDRAVRISPGNLRGLDSVAWMPDGRLIYSALAGDYRNLWIVDGVGGNPRQMTSGAADKVEVTATRDGRYVLYQSQGKIWRIRPDGSGLQRLTSGALDVHPCPSADGRWVIYGSFQDWSPVIGGRPMLWKTPIDGGEPVKLFEQALSLPQVSADGRLIAAVYFPGSDSRFSPVRLAVVPFDGKSRLKTLDRLPGMSNRVYWTPDGRGLIYQATSGGVGNLWRQSLDGGPAARVTNFKADEVFDFAWSLDGKRLALARGRVLSDVVLIGLATRAQPD